MANLKRNAIELVTGVNGEEVETKVFYTPPFIPLSVVYEAIDLSDRLEAEPKEGEEKRSEREIFDELANFVATSIYGNQFTKEELLNGLHAPQAIEELQSQILFVARGEQTPHQKKLVNKKK